MNETWLTITEKAASKLRELAVAEEIQAPSFRMAVVRTHCMGGRGFSNKLEMDSPREDDNVVQHDDIQLCVDPTSRQYLNGSVIDYIEADGKEGFSIRNPNVRSKCPCGRHDIFE